LYCPTPRCSDVTCYVTSRALYNFKLDCLAFGQTSEAFRFYFTLNKNNQWDNQWEIINYIKKYDQEIHFLIRKRLVFAYLCVFWALETSISHDETASEYLMNKNIFTTIISLDKTKTFTDIEPFYMTCDFFCWYFTYRMKFIEYLQCIHANEGQLSKLYWNISEVSYVANKETQS
jgi:hypothetical protein